MHYAAIVDGEEHEIEVVESAPGQYEVIFPNKRFHLDVQWLGGSSISMLVDDEHYNVEIEKNGTDLHNVLLRGEAVGVEVMDLRKLRLRNARGESGTADGPAEIASPMPGKVVAVLVNEGDEVQEGQGIVVVEAMKMENELRAPKAGVVKSIQCAEGDSVDGGACLCVIE